MGHMSRGIKKVLGTALAVTLVGAAFMLPASPAGAAKARRDGSYKALGLASGISTSGRAFDYRDLKPKLSKAQFAHSQIVREEFDVPMSTPDLGTCPQSPNCPVTIHVEVVRPKPVKPYATILEVSPYHGTIADRSGSRIFPGPKADPLPDYVDNDEKGGVPTDKTLGLAGYFAPRGYAVVFVDLRGTGRSGGCLDHLGVKDQADAKDVLNWIAKQPWSNGRIGMTGHSYVGSTPQMYASTQATQMKTKPLKTIVPSAGLAAMYHHKFQHGVPYFLQYVGPAEAYIQLAYQSYAPSFLGSGFGDKEEDFPEDLEFVMCQGENSAVMSHADYESGQYDDSDEASDAVGDAFVAAPWDAERDFRKGVTKANIPIFAVHGVNDNAARIPALDWFHDRDGKQGDKAWIGQWDHGSGMFPVDRTCEQHATEVNCPSDQWTLALHAWFDKHLKRNRINTGPATEIFLNDRKTVFQGSYWPPRPENRGTPFWLHPQEWGADGPGAEGLMKLLPYPAKAADAGSASFLANPQCFLNECSEPSEITPSKALGWESPPMKNDVILAGIPKLRLFATIVDSDATPPYIIGTLYDISPDGSIECVETAASSQRYGISKATYAMNPELAQGDSRREFVRHWTKPNERDPVLPVKTQFKTRGMSQAHLLEKGHRLRLVITTSQPDKFSAPQRQTGEITIHMGGNDVSKIGVPVVATARLRTDPFYKNGGADRNVDDWESQGPDCS